MNYIKLNKYMCLVHLNIVNKSKINCIFAKFYKDSGCSFYIIVTHLVCADNVLEFEYAVVQ